MCGFTFQISQDIKLLQRWFSPQNEPNDSKFKIRQTPTVMTCQGLRLIFSDIRLGTWDH